MINNHCNPHRDKSKFNKGFFINSRSLYESNVWYMPPIYLKIWIWIIGACNHAPRKCYGIMIERSQMFTSYPKVIEALGFYTVGYRKISPTKEEVRGAFNFYTKQKMITKQRTTRGLIVTVLNYDDYQNMKNYETHTENHSEDLPKPPKTPHYTQSTIKKERIEKESFDKKICIESDSEKDELCKFAMCIKDRFNVQRFKHTYSAKYGRFPHDAVLLKVCRNFNKNMNVKDPEAYFMKAVLSEEGKYFAEQSVKEGEEYKKQPPVLKEIMAKIEERGQKHA